MVPPPNPLPRGTVVWLMANGPRVAVMLASVGSGPRRVPPPPPPPGSVVTGPVVTGVVPWVVVGRPPPPGFRHATDASTTTARHAPVRAHTDLVLMMCCSPPGVRARPPDRPLGASWHIPRNTGAVDPLHRRPLENRPAPAVRPYGSWLPRSSTVFNRTLFFQKRRCRHLARAWYESPGY